MISNYLQILQESLERKLRLLTDIEAKSREQSDMLKSSRLDIDSIDRNMDEKTELIQEVLKLDDGFEHLYERIKEELATNKEQYKTQILQLQALISKVTEKSTSIQVIEARNKSEMDLYFSKQKKGLQYRRNAMSVASDYYQNMNKVKHVSPQFLDKKK